MGTIPQDPPGGMEWWVGNSPEESRRSLNRGVTASTTQGDPTSSEGDMQTITPFLWFEREAGEAAKFYTSVFKNSRINHTVTLADTPSGKVEVISIELLGQQFTLLDGGPHFKFNESISFVVQCETQEEIDYYWNKLSVDPQAGQCGWLKDKYGVSWQIVPAVLTTMLRDKDPKKVARVTDAFLKMKKFEIEALKRAYDSGT